MSSSATVPGRKYIKKRDVGIRYGKSSLKTVQRWVAAGILPEPDLIINGTCFWDEDRLDEYDRARTIAAGARGRRPAPPHREEKPTNSAV